MIFLVDGMTNEQKNQVNGIFPENGDSITQLCDDAYCSGLIVGGLSSLSGVLIAYGIKTYLDWRKEIKTNKEKKGLT